MKKAVSSTCKQSYKLQIFNAGSMLSFKIQNNRRLIFYVCTVVLNRIKKKDKKKVTLLTEEMTHTPLSPTLGFPNMHSAVP